MEEYLIIIIVCTIFLVLCVGGFLLWWFLSRPQPSPPTPSPVGSLALLTASPGTQILDGFKYLVTGTSPFTSSSKFPNGGDVVTNSLMDPNSGYIQLVDNFISESVQPLDPSRATFLAYITSIYPLISRSSIQQLTTDQLQGWYRSLVFYYITTSNSQPDGGWWGSYWIQRQLDDFSHENDGCSTSTSTHNEALLFDEAWGNIEGDRTQMWGNHIFTQAMQSSLRKGMRNSTQVLAENPSWGGSAYQYGGGGFPSNVYLEMLMFPQEHPDSAVSPYQYGMGFPTGCEAYQMFTKSLAWCTSGYRGYPCDGGSIDSTTPLMQPTDANDMPYATEKPQWFYFSQGNGMFWNLGITSVCYNYIDFFLNAPMGKVKGTEVVGWSQMYPGPSKGGLLGFDIHSNIKEHDYEDPIYSMKLILEFLSRTAYPEACGNNGAATDPNTGLPGLGYCVSPCTGTACSMSGASIYTSHSLDKQASALMGIDSYWYDYNPQGDRNPTASTWPQSCVPSDQSPQYPSRTPSKEKMYDNRYLITGWVNGHFYGFPQGQCMGDSTEIKEERQIFASLAPGVADCGEKPCNPFSGGIPGTDPETGDIIYGKTFTQDSPLVYYDSNNNEIYSTWYGKELDMDEETALALLAEMYSCGDTGWENSTYTWPFGSYFSYGQDLGSPGKDLAIQMSQPGYTCTSIQFTATPTSYENAKVQPAYDFEIQWNPIASGSTGPATAVSCVTLDITADFDGEDQTPGTDLRLYCGQNKGALGGFVRVDSPAGKTAQSFSGSQLKVSNWTTLNPPSFTAGQPNAMDSSITNNLQW